MESIIDKFKKITVWKNGNHRAPHKPLLILWAIGQLHKGNFGPWLFSNIESEFKDLLSDFGPSRKTLHPEYPFTRLVNDDIWEISTANFEPNKDYSRAFLRLNKISGCFKEPILSELIKSTELSKKIVQLILDNHFPETYHDDIIAACGLKLDVSVNRNRDAAFRERILTLYQYQCAVCEYDIRIGRNPVGLEAAHIKWQKAGGPNVEQNGVALCSVHHKLFDYGCFHFDSEYKIKVSQFVNGRGAEQFLYQYEGKELLNLPRESQHYPDKDFLQWHVNEVFKSYS